MHEQAITMLISIDTGILYKYPIEYLLYYMYFGRNSTSRQTNKITQLLSAKIFCNIQTLLASSHANLLVFAIYPI